MLALILLGAPLGAQDTTGADSARRLPGITSVAAREAKELQQVGFYVRVKQGSGEYLTPEQVEKLRNVKNTSAMVQSMRGIKVDCPHHVALGDCGIGGLAGTCMSTFVDGIWQPYKLDERVSPDNVYAIEVYNSASKVPIDVARPADDVNCGAIVVWTRARFDRETPAPPTTRRRLLQTGIVAGVMFSISLLLF